MKMRIGVKRFLKSIALMVTLAILVFGQAPIARADMLNIISGTLTDRAGNPVINATLDFMSSIGQEFQVFTDSNGTILEVLPLVYISST